MKFRKPLKTILSLVLSFVTVAAITLTMTSCDAENTPSTAEITSEVEQTDTFLFTVTDADGVKTEFTVKTEGAKTVGEALMNENLIQGENGQFGLYVKTVNGITADADKDGAYWAFLINGELAPAGVDSTGITPGNTYSFVYTLL